MLLNPDMIKESAEKTSAAMEGGNYRKAGQAGRNLSPARAAAVFMEKGALDSARVLQVMDKKRAGRIISCMPPEFSVEVLGYLETAKKFLIANSIPPDNIGEILEHMGEEERFLMLSKLDAKIKSHLERVQAYPRQSSGRVMSPIFLSVNLERSVEETLESIMSAPAEIDRRPYVYVLDEAGRLYGVVSVKDLLRAEGKMRIKELVRKDVTAVRGVDPAFEAAEIIKNRRLTMLPVTDNEGAIEGVITFDDAMRVLSSRAHNLISSYAGTYEETFFTSPLKAARGRLPWMAGNIILNLGAVAVITRFEATIAAVALLAAFIPMITDMGGNVGIQSLSVSIRSIALGEAKIRDFRKIIRKELIVGAFNGFLLGTLFGLIAFGLRGNPYLGLLAGGALGINVLVAGIAGGALPFLIKALGKDPAMMTGPFLTTLTDITGVSVYLGLSTLFISYLA